jgi:glutathione S-transferase
MLTLVSYPGLYGLPDNNAYGLKVYAFLRLCRLAFRHEHVVDTSRAPRGQLPYILDDGVAIGDSDAILSYLIATYGLDIDADLTPAQRTVDHLLRRTLDDLYWVMSWSRWQDARYWPAFRDAFLRDCPMVSEDLLETARAYNAQRYHYQGIGRYDPEAVYGRGLADLAGLESLLGGRPFLFGDRPHAADASAYGFLANIYFCDIDTPLRAFVLERPGLARYCERLHATVTDAARPDAVASPQEVG